MYLSAPEYNIILHVHTIPAYSVYGRNVVPTRVDETLIFYMYIFQTYIFHVSNLLTW